MTKAERTSKRVAAIAARILASEPFSGVTRFIDKGGVTFQVSWEDIKAMAASCLTQAPDKPKRRKVDMALDPRDGGGPMRMVRGKWVKMDTKPARKRKPATGPARLPGFKRNWP